MLKLQICNMTEKPQTRIYGECMFNQNIQARKDWEKKYLLFTYSNCIFFPFLCPSWGQLIPFHWLCLRHAVLHQLIPCARKTCHITITWKKEPYTWNIVYKIFFHTKILVKNTSLINPLKHSSLTFSVTHTCFSKNIFKCFVNRMIKE